MKKIAAILVLGMFTSCNCNQPEQKKEEVQKEATVPSEKKSTVQIGTYDETFTDANGKSYHIILNTTTETPTATIKFDEQTLVLPQIEAWARGSEYQLENTDLRINGEEATLTIDGKKIQLSK